MQSQISVIQSSQDQGGQLKKDQMCIKDKQRKSDIVKNARNEQICNGKRVNRP